MKQAIITTYSGININLLDPHPEDINIIDIAVGLSRQGRWANQSRIKLTVAEHSTVGASLIDQDNKLGFLLHDGAEGYFGDLATPIKDMCPEFTKYEERMRDVIMMKWGCKWNEAHEEMDKRLMKMEFAYLMNKPGDENYVDYKGFYDLCDERMIFDRYMNWFNRLTR